MIGRIAGRLEWKGLDSVLIDCRGVGYIVHVSERTMAWLPPVGEPCALFTELLVREDLLQLFGFPSMIEKEWHKLLTTVQGVGSKAAMAILGALGHEGVARAITLGDARAVQSAPGVGPKLAQRVILELKSKAPSLMALGGTLHGAAPDLDVVEPADAAPAPAPKKRAPRAPAEPTEGMKRAGYAADALSALSNLGYGPGDAAEAVAAVAAETPDADTTALIRLALRRLAPR